VRSPRRRKWVKDPAVVKMAIAVVAVVVAGIVEEAEGMVAVVIISARRVGTGITATTIGVGSRATGLVTVEENSP
jgi:hypothetical protein